MYALRQDSNEQVAKTISDIRRFSSKFSYWTISHRYEELNRRFARARAITKHTISLEARIYTLQLRNFLNQKSNIISNESLERAVRGEAAVIILSIWEKKPIFNSASYYTLRQNWRTRRTTRRRIKKHKGVRYYPFGKKRSDFASKHISITRVAISSQRMEK